MKKALIVGLMALPAALSAQVDFSVIGKVAGVKPEAKAYLHYLAGDEYTLDSANVVNGTFKFHGTSSEPSRATVLLLHHGEDISQAEEPDLVEIYVETGAVTITAPDSLVRATVSGGPLNKEFLDYKGQSADVYTKEAALKSRYLAASEDERRAPALLASFKPISPTYNKHNANWTSATSTRIPTPC